MWVMCWYLKREVCASKGGCYAVFHAGCLFQLCFWKIKGEMYLKILLQHQDPKCMTTEMQDQDHDRDQGAADLVLAEHH